MLKKVELHVAGEAFGKPPLNKFILINPDFIITVKPFKTEYPKPCVLVTCKDFVTFYCVGTLEDFLEPQPTTPAADPYFGEPLKEGV